jgi:hypothetical protein
MKEWIEDWLTKGVAAFAILFLIYVLSAPSIMMSIARQRGSFSSFPAIYQPIVSILESDFNGPALWYFNDVWHSGIILLGEETTPPRVIVMYVLGSLVLVVAMAFPFVQRRLRRTQP